MQRKRRQAVAKHYATGQLADHNPAQRTCLGGCGKLFWSKGPGNRVCGKCASANRMKSVSRAEEMQAADRE